MIAARQGDGRFGPSPWVPNDDPGHWQPLLNPDGTQMLDPTPWVGGVRPFLVRSSSQFRTDGPQPLRSRAWAKDFNEVKRLGGDGITTPSARTAEQTHIALFWQSAGGPGLTFNAVARNLIDDPTYSVDIVDSALLFGMLNLSSADAAINCWNDKYYWDFWRPWQAIREADRDATGRPSRTRPGRRSSPRRTPSTRRGASVWTARSSRCCRCSSARARSDST